MAELLSDLLDC